MTIALLFFGLLVLLLIGVPIAICLGLSSLAYCWQPTTHPP